MVRGIETVVGTCACVLSYISSWTKEVHNCISKITVYLSAFCHFSDCGLLAASRKVKKLTSYSTVNCTMQIGRAHV